MTKEEFLSRSKAQKTIDITLSDGAVVKCRKLSQAEVEKIRRHYATEARVFEGFRYIAKQTLLDETGDQMFDESDSLDTIAAGVDFDDVKTIAAAVTEFSGLTAPEKQGKN